MTRLTPLLALLLPLPALADPALPPGLAPLSAEATLAAVARIRPADRSTGGCTAVLIAPDTALTAAHCARGAVAGPAAMRLTFRPDSAPFAVTIRAVAFHAARGSDPLSFDNAHADIALLRLAQPVPPDIATPIPLATAPQAETTALYGYLNAPGEALHGHPHCAAATIQPDLIVSDCSVVSGFSGAPLLSGRPGDWRVEGIAVAQVFGQPFRALIADVVPWPDFAGPYALPAPPSAPPSAPAETSP
jgi:protease YdgD